MAFELYAPVARADSVRAGTRSLNSLGKLVLATSDLRRQGINGKVAIMVDATTFRLAFRKPLDSEPSAAVTPNKTNTTATVSVSGALRQMNLDPQKIKGRRSVVEKDNLLIVQFK